MEYKTSTRRNLILNDIDVDRLQKTQKEIEYILIHAQVEDLDFIIYDGAGGYQTLNANAFINQMEQVHRHLEGILDMIPKKKK